jgi:prepilin-type N-terminal cleavage/methylation domain-containing protein
MRRSMSAKSSLGFTLMEMMVALAVGLIVIGAAVQLFSSGVNATWVVSQRAEMQQDARAASNLLTKDISLAGAGLPTGGVALASGPGVLREKYGCDFTGACYLGPGNNVSINYPQQTVGANTINYLYGVIPGWRRGITINGAAGATDVISVVYADSVFLLRDYTVKFNDINGNSITFTLPNPAPNPLDQAVNNPAVGLQQGDLVLFTSNVGGNTAYAVGEVTAPVPAGGGPNYTVAFGNTSPLLFNQNAATSGDLKQIVSNVGNTAVGTTATRVWVITYYLDNNTGVPRLMRQVNGRVPVPVAENVADLRFTYDTYDSSGNLLNATGDGGMGSVPPISPSLIRAINIAHLTVRSQLRGTKGYQSLDMQTSISARNMSFIDRYK